MSNLVERLSGNLKNTTGVVSDTLAERLQRIRKETYLCPTLLDKSGSMLDIVQHQGRVASKWEILKAIVSQMRGEYYSFGSDFVVGVADCPEGGTNMALAFREMRDRGITGFVLVTDGVPNSEPDALKAAQGMLIEIVYVGPEPRPRFLDQLARQSGGSVQSCSVGESLQAIETAMQALPYRTQ